MSLLDLFEGRRQLIVYRAFFEFPRAGEARRRLPMVEMDPGIPLIGLNGPVTLLDAFEGRQQLIAYYFMWHTGHPAPEQCEGCTWVTTQVRELSYIHSRDVTFAVFSQGPYEESARYREFMGWEMPWYSALGSLETLLVGRRPAGRNSAPTRGPAAARRPGNQSGRADAPSPSGRDSKPDARTTLVQPRARKAERVRASRIFF